MSNHRNTDSLRPFFEPKSVAVVGASRTPGKGGYNIIENLLRLGYPGKIYPVNPRAKRILGLAAYPELENTPEPPELALIVLPPSMVLKALEECVARGVKAVIIESAGFGEMSESGARLEKQIVRVSEKAGIRIMGPNSVGTINPEGHFDASLGRLNKIFLPKGDIRPGPVGFIGQTGLFTGVYLPLISSELGISKIVCLGNKCDVDESDMLEYFGEDTRTKIIAMYLESVKDGQRFLGLSRRIVREKPIVVMKSAVTKNGARPSDPDWWQVRSPVDVWTAVEASGFEATYTTVIRAVLEDDGVDAVVVIMGANDWVPGKDVPAMFADIKKEFPHKPIITVNPLGDRKIYLRMCRGFQEMGIPSYTSDEDAITSLAALWRYQQHLLHTD